METGQQISIFGGWCQSVITGVKPLHVPVVPRHCDTASNTVLGCGDKNIFQRQKGQTVEYKLPDLPKFMGFLKCKPRLHSELLFPVLMT